MPPHTLLTALATLLLAGLCLAEDAPGTDRAADEAKPPEVVVVPFHGNTVCPVTNRPAKRTTSVKVGGERIYVCCRKCKKRVADDPQAFLPKAYPADAIRVLGNEKCPISGHETDGKTTLDWQGYRVRLCCEDCTAEFLAAPARTLTLMQHPAVRPLGNQLCIVMEDEENTVEDFFLYGDLLIDSCCGDCPEEFAEDPDTFLAAYRKAQAEKKEGKEKPAEEGDDGK